MNHFPTAAPDIKGLLVSVGSYRFSPDYPARIVIENRKPSGYPTLGSVRIAPVGE